VIFLVGNIAMISCYTTGFFYFFLFDFFRVVSLCEVVSNLGSVCFSANAYFVFVTLVVCVIATQINQVKTESEQAVGWGMEVKLNLKLCLRLVCTGSGVDTSRISLDESLLAWDAVMPSLRLPPFPPVPVRACP